MKEETEMKQTTAIYTLTSELHDEKAVEGVAQAFLTSLGTRYELKGSDYSDYGSHALNLIYVRTGSSRRKMPSVPPVRTYIRFSA